ncbi:hypothetical protein [Burkholderia latens]|uniref:hypothetical protein n=1 Tax=Burkholderia latens TaxID=488446 RepID=UPI00158939C9|nr:hypothetical protein [Burkholderia latens]
MSLADGVRPDSAMRWNDWERDHAYTYVKAQLGTGAPDLQGMASWSDRYGLLGRQQLEDLALTVFVASGRGAKPLPDNVRKALDAFVKSADKAFNKGKGDRLNGFHAGATKSSFQAASSAVVEWMVQSIKIDTMFKDYRDVVCKDVLENIVKKDSRLSSGQWQLDCSAWDLGCQKFKLNIADAGVELAKRELQSGDDAYLKVKLVAYATRLIGELENHVREASRSSPEKSSQDASAPEQSAKSPLDGPLPSVDTSKQAGPYGWGQNRWPWSQQGNCSPTITNSPTFTIHPDRSNEALVALLTRLLDPFMEVVNMMRDCFLREKVVPVSDDNARHGQRVSHAAVDSEVSVDDDVPSESTLPSRAKVVGRLGSEIDGNKTDIPNPPPVPQGNNGKGILGVVRSAQRGESVPMYDSAFMRHSDFVQALRGRFAGEDIEDRAKRRAAAISKLESRTDNNGNSVVLDNGGRHVNADGGSRHESSQVFASESSASNAIGVTAMPQEKSWEVRIPKVVVTTNGGVRNGTDSSATAVRASS